jgi:hypothetical protein
MADNSGGESDQLTAGYRDMAADREREHEAHSWIEGIGEWSRDAQFSPE